jgi:hypothetical protein
VTCGRACFDGKLSYRKSTGPKQKLQVHAKPPPNFGSLNLRSFYLAFFIPCTTLTRNLGRDSAAFRTSAIVLREVCHWPIRPFPCLISFHLPPVLATLACRPAVRDEARGGPEPESVVNKLTISVSGSRGLDRFHYIIVKKFVIVLPKMNNSLVDFYISRSSGGILYIETASAC